MLKGISQEEGPKEFPSIRSTVEHSDMVDVTRHSSKIDEKPRRNLVRDAATSPISGYTGFLRYETAISRILHMSGLWGRVARRKLFLTKKNIQAGGITLFGAFGPFSSDGTGAFSQGGGNQKHGSTRRSAKAPVLSKLNLTLQHSLLTLLMSIQTH